MSTAPLKYGLPLRPPTASTTLWAHILKQDTHPSTSLSDIPIIPPPTIPLDKNATSMRVLLHDTQANFEKFAIHVGKLIDGINETKHEIKTTNDLFERDRQTLVGDIIDLVNRSQKEIQKSIGSPCQNATSENYFKDVNHRLETLDHRLDAIQAFNQTHSQALQTQIQAIQILLDKQGTIVSAVLPLLPLLQAVPLHVETTRNILNDAISKLASTQRLNSDSPDVAVTITGKRKRSQKSSSSSPLPESPSKRRTLVPKNATPTARVQSFREKSRSLSVERDILIISGQDISAVSNAPSSALAPAPFPPDMNRLPIENSHDGSKTPQVGPKTITQNFLTPRVLETAATRVLFLQNSPIAPMKGKVVPAAVALGNMKDTPRVGRRFIPLADSEDEDEE